MQNFVIGQRWTSETEPELGLGILVSTSRHQVSILFPASNETRLYATNNAPIKRVEFRVGDSIQSQTGQTLLIDSIKVEEGIITYICDGVDVPEAVLADTTSFSKPEERLISGQYDKSSTFELRYETMAQQAKAKQSSVAGFIGGRIDLIPHQLYIASEVSDRYMPRVLLADEVG
ncbi:MAG: RNA polymerase-binding ATPase, partial [Verrucomicrobiota bacterium]|nr:RNA polymerase-binding ATPase [Verrucomicrobiota bacterium]